MMQVLLDDDGRPNARIACFSCCTEMILIVSVWILFLLVSAEFFAV